MLKGPKLIMTLKGCESPDLVSDPLDPGRQQVHDLLLRRAHHRRVRPGGSLV